MLGYQPWLCMKHNLIADVVMHYKPQARFSGDSDVYVAIFAHFWRRRGQVYCFEPRVICYCCLKEKNLCLGSSYKTKDVFIRLSYYYYCEKPICMRCRITQFADTSVRLCPFPGLCVREFESSDRNLVNRIIKITHAHNLHNFFPFTIHA